MKKTTAVVLAFGAVGLSGCGTRLPGSSFASDPVGAQQATIPRVAPPVGASQATGSTVISSVVGKSDVPAALVIPGTAGPALTRRVGTTSKKGSAGGVAPGAAPPTTGINGASDRGVSATTITLGNVVSAGGIFGAEEFGSSKYGAVAYFADLNRRGGINGRQVRLLTYNDNGDGSQDVAVVKQAVETDKVFSFVGNNIFAYTGVEEVQSSATPDIGGQPLQAVYYKYSHLFNILGTNDPRDNVQTGFNGNNYETSEYGQFFKQKVGSTAVGVVYYQVADSKRGADVIGETFRQAGLKVTLYPVNVGLPNFANTVAQMQADGVDTVADAMDSNGNAKLCQAMEGNDSFIGQVKAKVSTIGAWSQRISTEFSQTPTCRNLIYVTGSTRSYADVSVPSVAAFRAAMKKYFPGREPLMSQWTYESWIAGQLFTEAATSCGANLTRACVEAYLVKPGRVFTMGGVTKGFSWDPEPESTFIGKSNYKCTSVARWSDAVGTFVTVGDLSTACYTTPYFKYPVN